MGLTIPPAVNYAGPIASLPVVWDREPNEGSRIVPCEIDWGAMGGASNCVSVNLYGMAAQTLSQICALSVDNSSSAADVTFVFPDTSQTYTVRAGTPIATFPVFTNQTQFFVSAPNAQAADVVRFGVLNSVPPPVALSEAAPIQQSAGNIAINLAATGSTQIVPATVNGTLTAVSVTYDLGAGSPQVPFQLLDGTGKLLAQASGGSAGSGATYITVLSLSDIAMRFQQGIRFVLTGGVATAGSTAAVNLYYTVP